MRTNIVIDDELLDEAKQLTGLKTKHAVVEQALKTLIMIQKQEKTRSLRGKLRWEGNLVETRRNRFGASR